MPELNPAHADYNEATATEITNEITESAESVRPTTSDPADFPLNSIVDHGGRFSVRDVEHRAGSAQAATFTVYAPGTAVGGVWGVANDDYIWRGVRGVGHEPPVYMDGDVEGSTNNVFEVFRTTVTPPGFRHLEPPPQFMGSADSEEIARNRATAIGDVFVVGNDLLVVLTFTAGVAELNRPFWRDLLQDETVLINGTTLPAPEDVSLGDRRKLHILLQDGVIHTIAHLRPTDSRIGQLTVGQSGGTLGFRRGQYGRMNPALNIERLYNVLDTSHTGSAMWLYVDASGTIPRQPNVTLYYREQDSTGNWRRELLSGGGDGSYVSADHLISAVPRIERGKTYDIAITRGGSGTANIADLPTRTDYFDFYPAGLSWVTLLDADAVDINRVHLDTVLNLAVRQPRHFPVSVDWDSTNERLSVQLPDGSVVEEGDLIVLGPIPADMDATDEAGFTMRVDGGTFYDVTGQDQSPIAAERFHAGRYYQALVLDLEYVILDTFNLRSGAQAQEQEGSSSGITTIGGIFVSWRLQQYSATEPAASSIPEPENGSFSTLGDWIREDEDPMTLGQNTALQQWLGLGSGFLQDDGTLTNVTKQVIAAWNLQYNENDAGTEPAESNTGWSNTWSAAANWRRFRMPSGDWRVEAIPDDPNLQLTQLYYGAAHGSSTSAVIYKNVPNFGSQDFPFIVISIQPFDAFGVDGAGVNRAHKRNNLHKIVVPRPRDGWRSTHFFFGGARLGLIYRANENIAWGYLGITRDTAFNSGTWSYPADSGAWNSATQRLSFSLEFDNEDNSNHDEVSRLRLADYASANNRFYLRVEAAVV